MIRATRRALLAARCAAAAAVVLSGAAGAQTAIDVYELADYRLTSEVFERFARASHRVADVTREDPAFTFAPLFTKDVALSGDAVEAAAGLVARIENHPGLKAALEGAGITTREYTKFAITLIAAHLAQGLIASGVLPRVPAGAPTINVAFVEAHASDVTAALASHGISD